MNWFYLALLAPALLAIVNLLENNLIKRKIYGSSSFAIIVSGILSTTPLLGIIFFPVHSPGKSVILLAMLGGFLLLSSYWFYFKSLVTESPSVVISMWKITAAIIPFLAYFLLNEALSINQYIGFSLVLIGSVGISMPSIRGLQFSKSLYLMVVASILAAFAAVIFKYIYTQTSFWNGFVFVALGMGVGGIFYLIVLKGGRSNFFKELQEKKRWIGFFFLAECLNILAVLISNLAVSKGPVSLVKVVEGVQPIYIMAFSLLLYPFFPKYFQEAEGKDKIKKVILMLVILAGLFLINR